MMTEEQLRQWRELEKDRAKLGLTTYSRVEAQKTVATLTAVLQDE